MTSEKAFEFARKLTMAAAIHASPIKFLQQDSIDLGDGAVAFFNELLDFFAGLETDEAYMRKLSVALEFTVAYVQNHHVPLNKEGGEAVHVIICNMAYPLPDIPEEFSSMQM